MVWENLPVFTVAEFWKVANNTLTYLLRKKGNICNQQMMEILLFIHIFCLAFLGTFIKQQKILPVCLKTSKTLLADRVPHTVKVML